MDPDPSLLGRERELAALAGLLDGHRIVTVTGVGGVGKTRLAMAAARQVPEAVICSLARYDAAEQVPPAIAETLGYPGWEAALVGRAERSGLLVLDNCEHLLDAAADAAEQLATDTPGVVVLATSREPLALLGERVLRLDPLDVAADPREAAASPAVQLFLSRAADAGSPLTLDADTAPAVVELCRRLDGLPLALELAAARTPTLTPGEILGHLDRRLDLLVGSRRAPARHRSLQAMLDWSHERLEPATRRFFDRLGVSDGLFTAEAAHSVAGEPGEDLLAVIGHLDQLVARSLVQAHRRGGRTWYGLLETLRAYARGHLIEAGEFGRLNNRCIDWTVQHCVEVREDLLRSWSSELAVAAEEMRHDVHDALGYTLDHDADPDRAFGMFSLLWSADLHQGRARLVADRGEALLARWTDPAVPGWAEVAALTATAHLVLDGTDRGAELAGRALDTADSVLASVIARRATALAGLTAGTGELGLGLIEDAIAHTDRHELVPWRVELETLRAIALAGLGRDDDALRAARTAHRDAATTDSPTLTAWAGLVHGRLLATGDPAGARAVLTQVVDTSTGHPLGLGAGRRALGELDLVNGEIASAARELHGALDILVGLDDAHVRGTLRWVAALARATGRDTLAAALAAAAGPYSAGDPIELLARPQLTARLAGLENAAVAPSLAEAVGLARRALTAIADDPGAEPGVAVVPTAPAPAAFRREGEIWTLTFDGRTVRLPDAKGLWDLAALLAKPGREVHSTELIGAAVESSDTGQALDTAARRSYEQRIVELQAQLVDAEDIHDQGTADRARLEMDLLVEQLTTATGLGGRPRRTGGSNERARSAVGWRLRAATRRITEVHPALGRHLRDTVHIGAWCSYQPETPVDWQL